MRILDAGNIMRLGHPYLVVSRETQTSLAGLFSMNPTLIRHGTLGAQMSWAAKCGPNVRYVGAVEVAHSLAVSDVLGGHSDETAIMEASEDWDPIIYAMAKGTMTTDALKAATDELGAQIRAVLTDGHAVPDPDPTPDPIPKPTPGRDYKWVPWAIAGTAALGLLCVLVAHARS
jgi:hypothetical protein